MEKIKKFYSPSEVQKLVFDNCISRTTLLKRIHDGSIPSIIFVQKIFVPGCWVEEQLAKARGGVGYIG